MIRFMKFTLVISSKLQCHSLNKAHYSQMKALYSSIKAHYSETKALYSETKAHYPTIKAQMFI